MSEPADELLKAQIPVALTYLTWAVDHQNMPEPTREHLRILLTAWNPQTQSSGGEPEVVRRAKAEIRCFKEHGCVLAFEDNQCGDQDQCEFMRLYLTAYTAGLQSAKTPSEEANANSGPSQPVSVGREDVLAVFKRHGIEPGAYYGGARLKAAIDAILALWSAPEGDPNNG